jgi:XRE family transcriptional regulator, regulator of sulfur utilization
MRETLNVHQTMSLGKQITDIRKSKGISQELLAENSRLSLRTIQRIESGSSMPRPYTLKVIANSLGVQVEQLTTVVEIKEDIGLLRRLNFACLSMLLLPVIYILIPLIFLRVYRNRPVFSAVGGRVISFQVLWTVTAFMTAIATHAIVKALTGSVSIGHMPPTLFLVYFVFVAINLIYILKAAIQLAKGDTDLYPFVPLLF